ncbi:SCO family protein [Pseudomonas entomophila]|jgi:protein SCO1/2|uniref:SCO family protein n=1 Tax=Pseudomonas entomophila TaxID=312306 RepID=UPI0015E3E65F|nr:SCO family protein [Pseudomonas entomophila]MBA1191542.1 SCO family protein [Pseudomonas entomophila]
MTRTQKTIFTLFGLLALIVCVFAVRLTGGAGQASTTELAQAGIILLPQGRNVPPVRMTDQKGQVVELDQLRGTWSLLFFGYTYCPDICPTTLAQLREIKRQLPQRTVDRLRVVLVSVDPARDTAAQLKQYLAYFDKDFIGLRGSVEDTRALSNALSIPFIPADTRTPGYTVDHSGNLAIIGPDGRQRGFVRAPFDTGKLVARLPGLVEGK